VALRSETSKQSRDSYGGLASIVYLTAIVLLVAGCAASTVAPENPQVVSGMLPFIQDGKTSKNEVFSRLGEPDYRHERGRIVAYSMSMCAVEEVVPFSDETRCREPGTYNLVLVFGPHNIVEQHSLVRVR
jgi:hypothetical protein